MTRRAILLSMELDQATRAAAAKAGKTWSQWVREVLAAAAGLPSSEAAAPPIGRPASRAPEEDDVAGELERGDRRGRPAAKTE